MFLGISVAGGGLAVGCGASMSLHGVSHTPAGWLWPAHRAEAVFQVNVEMCKNLSLEVGTKHFPCVLLTGAGHSLAQIPGVGKRLYTLMGGAKTRCRGQGLGEAINLLQLQVLGLDWSPGRVDLGPEL